MSITTSKTQPQGSFKSEGKKAAQKAAYSPMMEALTRFGYGVRGVIYVVMGLLAVQVVLGKGGALASPQGAIAAIAKQAPGMIFLWAILVGIVAYAVWGIIRAVLDPLGKGHGMKGLVVRLGFLVSAFGYAVLALSTYALINGGSSSGGGAQTGKFLSSIMSMPWGPWAVGIVGVILVAGGLYQVYLGFSSHFERQFRTYDLTAREAKMATNMGRFGTSARGVVFAVVGGLFCTAAFEANPSQPVGMDTALATLMRQPYGVWLVGVVAVGLMAFGLYSMLCAIWFRLRDRSLGG